MRRCELTHPAAELDGGTLAFGSRSWRIDAHAPRPGPDGEASGEILMRLVEEPMPDVREKVLARLVAIGTQVPVVATAGRTFGRKEMD